MNPPVAVQGHVNVVLGEPRAHLVVIGPGHNVTHALERYAKDYNLQNGVICSCVGDIDEVRLVTQRARGHCPPSFADPLLPSKGAAPAPHPHSACATAPFARWVSSDLSCYP